MRISILRHLNYKGKYSRTQNVAQDTMETTSEITASVNFLLI